MTDARDTALQQLVEKWRHEAVLHEPYLPDVYHKAAMEYKRWCAEELAALLAGARSPQTENDESRSPDGDGHPLARAGESWETAAAPLPPQQGHVHARDGVGRSNGEVDAVLLQRHHVKPGAGSEPADSHTQKLVVGEPPAVSPPGLVSIAEAVLWWEIELRVAAGRHSSNELDVIRTSLAALKALPSPLESAVSPPGPIALTVDQEHEVTAWAADDRLWTTQETVEFNLRIFARAILKLAASPPVATQEPR